MAFLASGSATITLMSIRIHYLVMLVLLSMHNTSTAQRRLYFKVGRPLFTNDANARIFSYRSVPWIVVVDGVKQMMDTNADADSTSTGLRLPLQNDLQSIISQMRNKVNENDSGAQDVRKQIFSRKFWKR
ncbi:hypothetical protein KIN20_007032 [Parelaphostrongylus tenuis]|uniref:Uncharacterized protein n=1 Tax=Parelaphostrongylus tenuis TaxID=148309 RepID=A0AAD5QJQ1_PARTN|nr:hypothetical protein KIN20_007032 [Parelaphostrongylus tenuis]